jgi:hypothetical protein
MIAGVSPIHILEIKVTSFRRRGNHPYLTTIRGRCNWYNKLWLYLKFGTKSKDDYVQPAEVHLINSYGRYIKSIECKSNDKADRLRNYYTQRLEEFTELICHNDAFTRER